MRASRACNSRPARPRWRTAARPPNRPAFYYPTPYGLIKIARPIIAPRLMHPLLRKHFSKAVGADGAVDLDRLTALVSAAYDRADKARRRTDRSITLMTDELAQINEQLEAKAVQRAAELEATRRTLSAALENVDQGIAMIGADDRLHVCNRRACQLLGLPVDIADKRPTSAEVLGAQIASEEFVGIDPALVELWRRTPLSQFPPVYERRRPNGTLLEIRTVTLTDGGCVRTFTDITERRERE